MTPRYYCTSGIIGAGKTNLALTLANLMNLYPINEPVNSNPYLDEFYVDLQSGTSSKTRSAAMMQMFLLVRRFRDHTKAIAMCTDKGVIGDRSIFEDTIFAKILHESGHITNVDYNSYLMAYNALKHQLKLPIFIYIDIEPGQALENVRRRGRGCEGGITVDYLSKLKQEYEVFRDAMSKNSVVVTIPAEDVYYPQKVVERLEELDKKLTYQDYFHYSNMAYFFPERP